MPQDGEIQMSEVRAKYSIADINLIDTREVDFANEFRLTFEISFGIGLSLLGVVVTEFNWIFFVTMTVFAGFGVISLFRYHKKYKEIKSPHI